MKTLRTFLALALLALPAITRAQTSGTLRTQTAQNWTTAPWMITSGPGTYPDGGGVATWDVVTAMTIGTVASGATITLDVPITLSGITYNSPFSMTLAGSATNNLGLASTGATFNVQLSIANTPTLFQLANNITAPITGGGSAGLTKIGNGTMTLGATVASTYTGGTHINGGILVISATAAIGDSVLGASGAGNGLSFDGGALFNNITSGWTTSRDVSLGAGGGTIYTNTNATINGVISGSGNLIDRGFATGAGLTLTNTNTYTGATIMNSPVASLTLSGNGSIATSSGYDFIGTVALNNSGTNVNNRLSDTAAITSHGANITLTGNASAATAETTGALNLANGITTLTVTPNAAQSSSLNLASVARQNNSTLYLRGAGLGGAPGAGVATITSAIAPTLVGGGGADGSTNISILPWAVGNTTSNTGFTAANNVGASLVTYGANGFRPLATSEYATTFGNATDNVRLTAATAAGSGVTANAVLFAPAVAATLSGGPINITSGAFLYSPTANVTGTVSAALNFGAAEGVITNTSALNISGAISGSNGVTYSSPTSATVTLTNTASNYTGNTTISSGAVAFSGTVAATGSNSVFGNSGTIVLNAGTNTAQLQATAATTLNRDVRVVGNATNYLAATSGSGFTFTLNGNIDLQNTGYLFGNANAAASAFIFNGDISGPGGLFDTGLGYVILNGNNSYSGGTVIGASTFASTFVAGSDNAFGTGTIYMSASGATTTIQGAGTTARTIANDLFFGSSTNAFGGTAPLTFTGGVNLNGARTVNVTNTAPTVFSGVVANGAITKTGTGALSLNSASGNTYTGGTVLGTSAGTLSVNNTSGSGTGSGTVSIGGTTAANRSTLSGNFTISGATSISGTLSPGNSVGTANFGSALTLAVNSNTLIEIASAASFDKLNVAGLLTLPGSATTVTFSIMTIGGYDAPVGTTFDIVDWGTLAANGFNPATQISFTNQPGSAGTALDTSNFLVNGSVTVAAVPEPSVWTMIVAGAGTLGTMLRFRRRLR